MKLTWLAQTALAGIFLAGAGAAQAQSLTLYCSADEAWCQQLKTGFEADTGITVDMTRKSSGETFAQVKAESSNPKGDVWWGGTGDPHLQAAEEDLTEAYADSPMRKELYDWAIKQSDAANGKTIGVYSGALGFGYNKDLLAKNNLPEPKCWADLIKPEFKGQIQVANPNSSGTAYTLLATLVQLMGEDKAFDYLKALHKNINQYTKSGSAPIKAAAQGETTIGIVFLHDAVAQTAADYPIVPVAPCEGTGYEIGSMSLIKGARNPDEAKKFYDWVLQAKVQEKAVEVNSFQIPSNKNAKLSDKIPDISQIKLIDYDFKKYGSSEERKRLLSKWDSDVGSQPQ
ncbi:extracellular solute-binding protein [Salmonella enterica subsp. enterica]|nr:extracellular solute-binding protein [Salmonella enterica subsp. enterica serovar Enteritidis]